jgi:glycosyltransferase domain-containing protein
MQIHKASLMKLNKLNDLTIILPTYGRDDFTKRFLLHCEKSKCPFHIIIGDGKPNKENKRFLSDKSNFPNLSYEYHVFNDKSYYHFYKKMNKLASLVKTKYAMQADNDDLIIFDGLNKLLQEIRKNKNFIMARGSVAEFNIKKDSLKGRLCYFGKIKSPSYSYNNNSVKKNIRINRSIKYAICTYYNIIEARYLKKTLTELEVCNFSDVLNHELYFSARMFSFGQEYFNPAILFYARQSGTTLNLHKLSRGWSRVFINTNFFRDFSVLKNYLKNANASEINTNAKIKKFDSDLIEAYSFNLSKRIKSLHDFFSHSNLFYSSFTLFHFLASKIAKKYLIKFISFVASIFPNFLLKRMQYFLLRIIFSMSKDDANIFLNLVADT